MSEYEEMCLMYIESQNAIVEYAKDVRRLEKEVMKLKKELKKKWNQNENSSSKNRIRV